MRYRVVDTSSEGVQVPREDGSYETVPFGRIPGIDNWADALPYAVLDTMTSWVVGAFVSADIATQFCRAANGQTDP